MRKVSTLNLFARGALRAVGATTLACSLAVFGCTTDRTPGAGAPERSGPAVGPAMPSETPGSESNRPIVPMASASMIQPVALLAQLQHRPNVDALSTAAYEQAFRGRVLGTVDPAYGVAVTGVAGADMPTGQFVNPALIANPQFTVNNTVNSIGQAPIVGADLGTSGGAIVGGAVVGLPTAALPGTGAVATTGALTTVGTTGAVTNVPMASAATTTGTTTLLPSVTAAQFQSPLNTVPGTTATAAAPVFLTPNTILTPTNAAIPTTVGQFAAGPGVVTTTVPSTVVPGAVTITNIPTGSLTPTVSSGAMTTPVIAANPPLGNVGAVVSRITIGSRIITIPSTAPAIRGVTTGQLQILRSGNGVTVTNIGTAAATSRATTTGTTGGHALVIH